MSDPTAAFEAMLARGQDSETLRLSLGSAYLRRGDSALAVEHFRKAIAIKSNYSAAWKMLGQALAEQGALAEALDAYDQGLQVAEANGDKQAGKEIQVFRKRVLKALDG